MWPLPQRACVCTVPSHDGTEKATLSSAEVSESRDLDSFVIFANRTWAFRRCDLFLALSARRWRCFRNTPSHVQYSETHDGTSALLTRPRIKALGAQQISEQIFKVNIYKVTPCEASATRLLPSRASSLQRRSVMLHLIARLTFCHFALVNPAVQDIYTLLKGMTEALCWDKTKKWGMRNRTAGTNRTSRPHAILRAENSQRFRNLLHLGVIFRAEKPSEDKLHRQLIVSDRLKAEASQLLPQITHNALRGTAPPHVRDSYERVVGQHCSPL